jgi:hypothetical protein
MDATGRTNGFLRGVGARRAAHDDLLQALDLLARAQQAPRRQMACEPRRRRGLHAPLTRAPCTADAPCSRAARAARVIIWAGSRRARPPTNCRANTSTAATCAAKLATCTCSAVLWAQHGHWALGCCCCCGGGTAQDSRRHCRQVHHHANVAGVHLAESRLTALPRRLCVRSAAVRGMEILDSHPNGTLALLLQRRHRRPACLTRSLDRDKAVRPSARTVRGPPRGVKLHRGQRRRWRPWSTPFVRATRPTRASSWTCRWGRSSVSSARIVRSAPRRNRATCSCVSTGGTEMGPRWCVALFGRA